jgi:L-alanine-DL-glutamate epimerase-like enolase superfamily enzyme
MQIIRAEVTPLELTIQNPVRMAHLPEITRITTIFVHIITRQRQSAWGVCVAHPDLTGEEPREVIRICHDCASLVPDLHPTNLEYSLSKIEEVANGSNGALCAFDLAFHDLLGLDTGLPLYKLLGGYRNSIPTAVTLPVAGVDETVERAKALASKGFRILKVKGGLDPEADVLRVQAVHRALPALTLRLDADGGYTTRLALDVGRALKNDLEVLEQPTPADDLAALRQVNRLSPVPVIADQSVHGTASALELASERCVSGLCVKVARCGGLRCARVVENIARAAQLSATVSCVIEPALLISAGLSLALSSPGVHYADLDGSLDLLDDPSVGSFILEEGFLKATEVPGLGGNVEL